MGERDNFQVSPPLFRVLLDIGTDFVGRKLRHTRLELHLSMHNFIVTARLVLHSCSGSSQTVRF